MFRIMQSVAIVLTSALFLLTSACTRTKRVKISPLKTVGAGLGVIVAIPIMVVGGVLAVAASGT